jgi:hypothetical protein
MNDLAFSTTKTLSRAALLCLALALPACTRDDSMGSAVNHDAAADIVDTAGIHLGEVWPDAAMCSKYPVTSRTDANGVTWWWWYFHWDTVTGLPGLCASYGTGAKMVVEVAFPANSSPTTSLPECTNDEIQNGGTRACAVASAYRFDAECTAAGLLFELPSQYAFDGYYHIESAEVPAAPRKLVQQDVHCSRDLYVAGGPAMGPIVADGGTDTADAPPGTCSQYPATSRTDANGVTWWSWYFHWNTGRDLGAFCGSFGTNAGMVLEVDYPQNAAPDTTLPSCTTDEVLKGTTRACAIDKSYRFEVPCLTGDLLIELPSENTFHGYYHIDSPAVATLSRHLVSQDVHCSRDLYITAPSFGPLDAGVAPADASDDAACPSRLEYDSPGCGFDAKLVCHHGNPDNSLIGVYYCGCNGRTIMGAVWGSEQPYQFEGCCPGDSGFGPLGSYSCPADGGLPYVTPRRDGGVDVPPPIAVGGSGCGHAPAGIDIPVADACPHQWTQCKVPDPAAGCLDTALAATARAAIQACGASCGDLEVGFSGGCASTVVEVTRLGTGGTVTHDAALACVQAYLSSTYFDCVPTEGWERIWIGSCTIL